MGHFRRLRLGTRAGLAAVAGWYVLATALAGCGGTAFEPGVFPHVADRSTTTEPKRSSAEPAPENEPQQQPRASHDPPDEPSERARADRVRGPHIAPNLELSIITTGAERNYDPKVMPTGQPRDPWPWTYDAMTFVFHGGGLRDLGPKEITSKQQHSTDVRMAAAEQVSKGAVKPGRPFVVDLEGIEIVDGKGNVEERGWEIRRLEEHLHDTAREIQIEYIEEIRRRTGTHTHVGFLKSLKMPERPEIGAGAKRFNTAQIPVIRHGRCTYAIVSSFKDFDARTLARTKQWWLSAGRECARLLEAPDPLNPSGEGEYDGTIILQVWSTTRGDDVAFRTMPPEAVHAFLDACNTIALENPRYRVMPVVWIQWWERDKKNPKHKPRPHDGWGDIERVFIPTARAYFAGESPQ